MGQRGPLLTPIGLAFFAETQGTGPWGIWTPDEIATAAQVPVQAVKDNWPFVYEAMVKYHVDTVYSMVGMIGTIAKESASTFAPVKEAFWLSEEWRKQNLRYYPWYGRGFIQTTWQSNYEKVRDRTGIDVVSNPDLLLDAGPAAEAACLYWIDPDHGPVFAAAEAGNWARVRVLVLGGPDADGTARIQRCADLLIPSARSKGIQV